MKLHLPKALHKRLLALMLTVGVLGTQQVCAADYTIGTSDNNDQRLINATVDDKIIFDKDGGYLTAGGATINAAVEINKLKLTDGYSGVTYTFKNTVSGTGEFSFSGSTGANTQTYVFEGDMSQYTGNMTIADNKTATFTFKGIEVGATSITGANVQFTEGASSATTINIKSDRTLIIGHEGQNAYGSFQGQSVDLSGATVNLTGGNVRFNGDYSSLGTLNADGGTLRLEDGVKDGNGSGDTAGKGLNIDTLNLVSNLLVNNCWKGSLDIDVLKGSGAVTFNTKNGGDVISVKIDSVEAGARILSNSGTLILGDGETSTINLSNTIDNKGTLILNGTLAVGNDDLSGFDSEVVGNIEDVTENGLFDIGTKYTLIKGNALDDSSKTTTVSYNGQTYNIADGITIGEKGFAVVESDKTVTLGGSTATEGTADATQIYVHGGKLAIAEGTYTVNTSATVNCDIIYTAGSMELAADATLQTVSGDISSIVKNSTGSGTLEIGSGVTNLIAGNNDTYGYDGKISVKSGGQLNLNQEGSGANSMNSITLANATIDMDGGKVRYFGGSATIGTINVNANSTFEAFATWNGDNEGIVTINNMNVTKDLTIEGQYESSITIKDLTLNSTMLLNANSAKSGEKSSVTIEKLSGTGMLQLQMGHYTIGAGTHTIDRIDASKGGNNTGTLTLATGANLTVNTMWVGLKKDAEGNDKTEGIKLGKGATLTRGEVKFTGTTESDSSISRVIDGNHGDAYGIGNASYVISNAAVEVKSDSAKTMYNRLMGVALTNSGTGKLTAGNGYNNLTELKALTGDIDLTWYNGQGQQGTISNLNIAAGRTVGAYTGDAGSTKATITAGGLTIGNAATLNANLVLNNGAALTFDGALAMGGSTLTLGTGLTLNADTLAAIKSLTGDERFELFTGVGALTLGDETFKMGENVLDATNAIDLSKYFALVTAQTPAILSDEQLSSGYYLGFDANGTVYAGLIPEPTTATLSLLALAALAARRRRK